MTETSLPPPSPLPLLSFEHVWINDAVLDEKGSALTYVIRALYENKKINFYSLWYLSVHINELMPCGACFLRNNLFVFVSFNCYELINRIRFHVKRFNLIRTICRGKNPPTYAQWIIFYQSYCNITGYHSTYIDSCLSRLIITDLCINDIWENMFV